MRCFTVFLGHVNLCHLLAVLTFAYVNPAEACPISVPHFCGTKKCLNNGKFKKYYEDYAAHQCLVATDCDCPGGFKGSCCENRIEWCAKIPCQNGGSCEDGFKDERTFICTCPEGYEGELCNKKRFQCRKNPCLHNGNCLVEHLDTKPNVRLKCDCPKGTSGERCQINYDDCQDHKCNHGGGDCVDGINKYTCKCRKGWKGEFCEVKDYCATAACSKRGGICTSFTNGTTKCECKKGNNGQPAYEGKNCEKIGPGYPCKKHYRSTPCHYGRRIFCKGHKTIKGWSCLKGCFSGKRTYWGFMAVQRRKEYWRDDKCRVEVGKDHKYGNELGYLDCSRGGVDDCISRNAALYSCHDHGKGGDC